MAKKSTIGSTAVLSSVAVMVTGVAVASGVMASDTASTTDSAAAATIRNAADDSQGLTAAELAERDATVSRSDKRPDLDATKQDLLAQRSGGQVTKSQDLRTQDPREIAREMMPEFGFSSAEFECLDQLWVSESDWDPNADNPTSSAYGIPQALTGGTHDLPSDYMSNPESQIRWGLGYIRDSYGTPCSAWSFKQGHNWY